MRRTVFAWPLAALLTASALAQYSGSTPPPERLKKGFDAMTPAIAQHFLTYLAGPETMGRGTGQPGYQKAAEYMAQRYKEFGLKPIGENGTYFQNLTFWRSYSVDEGSAIEAVGSGTKLSGGKGFRFNSISKSVDTTATVMELRPAGDQLGVDAAQLRDRLVVVHADKPSLAVRRAINRARPAAVLYVRDSLPAIEYNVARRAPAANATAPASVPSGVVTTTGLETLLGSLSMSEASGSRTARVSRQMVRVRANFASESVKVPNVIGLLEGSDPTLKSEVVGIGCHLDHLGVQGGLLYPGADDDGSGSAALLLVAKGVHANPVKPRRSILFMAFAAEEMGLLGAQFYTQNPLLPLDKMVAELQMDMVGRNSYGPQNNDPNRMDIESENVDTMRLVGSKRISTDLHNAVLDMNKHINFKFKYDAEDVYERSDHYMFARLGIPIAFLFDGFTPDYHQPTDTIDKINFTKISNAAKLFYLTAYRIGDRTERPNRDVKQ